MFFPITLNLRLCGAIDITQWEGGLRERMGRTSVGDKPLEKSVDTFIIDVKFYRSIHLDKKILSTLRQNSRSFIIGK